MKYCMRIAGIAGASLILASIAMGESWHEEIGPDSKAIVSVTTQKKTDAVAFTIKFPTKNPGVVKLTLRNAEQRPIFTGHIALKKEEETFVASFTVSREYLKNSRCDVPIEIDGGRGHAFYHFKLSSFVDSDVRPQKNTPNQELKATGKPAP